MELLEQYQKEIREDLAIDEMSIKQQSMQLPAKKHFWVARLIETKQQLQRLTKQKKKAKERLVKELMHKSPIKLTKTKEEKAAEKGSELQELNDKIDDVQLIVEYLEKVEKIFHNATWDFKNVIQLHFSEKA